MKRRRSAAGMASLAAALATAFGLVAPAAQAARTGPAAAPPSAPAARAVRGTTVEGLNE